MCDGNPDPIGAYYGSITVDIAFFSTFIYKM